MEKEIEEKKKTLIEYEQEISAAEQVEERLIRRRRVNNIKRAMMIAFVMVCAIPIVFCSYLMVKMNQLDRRLAKLVEQVDRQNQGNQAAQDSSVALSMDEQAYADLEKGTESDGVHVSLANTGEVTGNVSEHKEEKKQEKKQEPKGDENANGKRVYLTFDDGPSTYTGELLDILKEKQVSATFFVVYNPDASVEKYYKRIVDEGHSIGMHSYSHVYEDIYQDLDSFKADVSAIHDYIYDETGVDSKLYRFPGGSSNQVSRVDTQDMMEYLYNEGIVWFDWNSLSGDAVDGTLTPQELNENIMGYVRANAGDSVVLMHDLQKNPTTVEALSDLIDTLQAEGYEICALTESTKPVQHVTYEGAE